MPYIPQIRRDALDSGQASPKTAGEFNYVLTHKVIEYIGNDPLSYTKLNEIVGGLECAKLELYRRLAAPYEDLKIKENGDVY